MPAFISTVPRGSPGARRSRCTALAAIAETLMSTPPRDSTIRSATSRSSGTVLTMRSMPSSARSRVSGSSRSTGRKSVPESGRRQALMLVQPAAPNAPAIAVPSTP